MQCPSSSPAISNNAIIGNSASNYGGGVYCSDSSATITDNAITGNSSSTGGGVYCTNSSPTIRNNQITGNSATSGGGAIACRFSSSPDIRGNTIAGNSASSSGGGIYCSSSSPTIAGNAVTGNTASSGGGLSCRESSPVIAGNVVGGNFASDGPGGGVYCYSSSPTITGNTIGGNSCSDAGGGIYCYYNSPTITNNVVTQNTSGTAGGGICCSYNSAAITCNTLAQNAAPVGGGMSYLMSPSSAVSNNIVAFNSSGVWSSVGTPSLRNNDVYGNTAYDYSGLSPGVGDIPDDPAFVSKDYGNFHIRPGSVCVNAGWNDAPELPAVDMDGQARVQDGTVDIGADESDGSDPPAGPYTIVRVSPDGDDMNDGSSWTSAKRTVQAGLDAASVLGGEVWVRAGTYNERIALRLYAYLYGGFAGAETARSERNWSVNKSIIDGGGAGSVVTASLGLGYGASTLDGFTIRDGRTNANGGGIKCSYSSPTIANNTITANEVVGADGGGIYCSYSSPTITGNTITSNKCTGSDLGRGAGIYCTSSFAMISNNTIADNNSRYAGGGVYCIGSPSPTLTNNMIAGNTAQYGGGMSLVYSSDAIVTNNTIMSNSATENGGGVHCSDYVVGTKITGNTIAGNSARCGGGISCSSPSVSPSPCSPDIVDNTISCNSAEDRGGGIYCSNSESLIACNTIAGNNAKHYGAGVCSDMAMPTVTSNLIKGNAVTTTSAGNCGGGVCCLYYLNGSSPKISNNTIMENTAFSGGGVSCHQSSTEAVANNIVVSNSSGICNSGGTPTLRNNNVYGNTDYNYSGLSPGIGDISADPLFLAPWVGEYHLRPTSPCVNVGDNSFVTAGSTDLDGKARILPVGGTVDMGCYEYDSTPYGIRGIGQARAVPEQFTFQLQSKPVTAAFPGAFYAEERDRTGGIRVLSAESVNPGDLVTLTGHATVDNGERAIQADTVSVTPGAPANIPGALFARNNWLGGGPFFWNVNGEACGQEGITGGCGLNNIGLLVKTWGRFTKTSDTTFTLEDGSGIVLKCIAPSGVPLNESWTYVAVTGVSSCEKVDEELHRLVRATSVVPM